MVVSTNTRKGICEVCDAPDMVLYCTHGNIWMCSGCKADDDLLTTQNAQAVVIASRKIDAVIELKTDIFVSATTSFSDLQAAILADSTIPNERKALALMEQVEARIKTLDAVIFSEKAATKIKETERYALLQNAQSVASKLRESERARFKQYDVNYIPPVTKPIKSSKGPKKGFDKTALYAACKKHNVSEYASQVRGIMLGQNLDAEAAALVLAKILGKVPA